MESEVDSYLAEGMIGSLYIVKPAPHAQEALVAREVVFRFGGVDEAYGMEQL